MNLQKIYQEDYIFSFVCGSAAKNGFNKNSDIDIFLLVENNKDIYYKKYIKWYLNLHRSLGHKPDYEYPGEVVELNDFIEKINIYNKWEKSIFTSDHDIYDISVWMDMICSEKVFFLGDRMEFDNLFKISEKLTRDTRKKLNIKKNELLINYEK